MNNDSRIVQQQIGRKLRSDSEVSCRCHLDIPVVIKVPPKLNDGTPFPTTYWLTCPMYNKTSGSLESQGLIKELDKINTVDRFRISSIEPNLLTNEIIEFCHISKKFMPHFHIPLQSGSDRVLRLMRRRYDTKFYNDRINKIANSFYSGQYNVDEMYELTKIHKW